MTAAKAPMCQCGGRYQAAGRLTATELGRLVCPRCGARPSEGLPRRVARGADLIPGRWYRIVQIDPHDRDPSLDIGAVLMASPELKPGFLDPENHDADGMGTQWFADFHDIEGDYGAYRTLVNELEEVEAPA